jgi:hypothetical protein
MSKRMRNARAGLVALLVTGALGFGASSALASPAPPCPRLAIGRCTSLAQCQNQCAQVGGNVANARCETDGGVGCCYCPLAL